MAKIEKEVQKFIKSYQTNSSELWKVTIPDGRGFQIRKRGFLTKQDATAFAVKKYIKVLSERKGLKIEPSKMTFAEYSTEWLDSKRRDGLKESSAISYDDNLELRLNPYFGSFRIHELEKHHLRNFIKDMQKQGMSSASLRYSVALFKAIMKQAETDDLVEPRGISLISTPKHRKKEPMFWDFSQISFFLNATTGKKYHNLWTVALATGMRAGEISGLRWECVHFDKSFGDHTGVIEVRRIYNQKTRQVEETTKNGDRRLIPMLPQCRLALEKLKSSAKGDFVFGGNEPLDSSHFNRQLQAALKDLPQLPMITFHGLRHSFCSYLDSTAMNRRVISEIMGHRDLNTTTRYSHVNARVMGFEVSRWLEAQSKQKTSNLDVVSF